jgi:hypothetical protein
MKIRLQIVLLWGILSMQKPCRMCYSIATTWKTWKFLNEVLRYMCSVTSSLTCGMNAPALPSHCHCRCHSHQTGNLPHVWRTCILDHSQDRHHSWNTKCMCDDLQWGNTSNSTPCAESILRSLQSLSWPRNSLPFMEPEGSLPCSQEPATCPHPEPDKFSPHSWILFLNSKHCYTITHTHNRNH